MKAKFLKFIFGLFVRVTPGPWTPVYFPDTTIQKGWINVRTRRTLIYK
jgi:hypothetical protein